VGYRRPGGRASTQKGIGTIQPGLAWWLASYVVRSTSEYRHSHRGPPGGEGTEYKWIAYQAAQLPAPCSFRRLPAQLPAALPYPRRRRARAAPRAAARRCARARPTSRRSWPPPCRTAAGRRARAPTRARPPAPPGRAISWWRSWWRSCAANVARRPGGGEGRLLYE